MKNDEIVGLVLKWQMDKCYISRDIVLNQYTALIYYYVNKYKSKTGHTNDLFQEGMLGLMEAINKFDNKKNVKVFTYATFYVRHYIQNYTRKNIGIVTHCNQSNSNEFLEEEHLNFNEILDEIELEDFTFKLFNIINNFDEGTFESFMRRLNGLSYKKSTLKCSEAWDKILYNNGLKKIRKELHVENL